VPKPLLALAVVAALVSACGDDPKEPAAEPLPACTGLDSPAADAPTKLPLNLPLTPGATVLRVETQGKTLISYAKLTGDADQLVEVRDRVLAELKTAGYTASNLDDEVGYEAEAELDGKHHGTFKVTPLCKDLLQLRYKINQ
jgi:hypothetical protein